MLLLQNGKQDESWGSEYFGTPVCILWSEEYFLSIRICPFVMPDMLIVLISHLWKAEKRHGSWELSALWFNFIVWNCIGTNAARWVSLCMFIMPTTCWILIVPTTCIFYSYTDVFYINSLKAVCSIRLSAIPFSSLWPLYVQP